MSDTSSAARRDTPLLRVRDLSVDYLTGGRAIPAVRGVDLDLTAGEVVAVVGESGSGKSTIAAALTRLLPQNARIRGAIEVSGKDVARLRGHALRRLRGEQIGVVFQHPGAAFNPVYTIGDQIAETLEYGRLMSPHAARERAVELLDMVRLPDPEARVRAYPHQLSGGQLQRAMIAQALALEPRMLVADEPTTALDVTVQAEILALLDDLRRTLGLGIVLISHDMGVVASLADRVVVMHGGSAVEKGTAESVLTAPRTEVTQKLLDAVPRFGAPRPPTRGRRTAGGDPVVELEGIAVDYPGRSRRAPFRAIEDLTLRVGQGEVLGLVGESGSGKTTIGRVLAGLTPVSRGRAIVDGVDITAARGTSRILARRLGVVFQDPGSSLDPRRTVGDAVAEPLRLHTGLRGRALAARVDELLGEVKLPEGAADRHPHQLSGGQRQRVSIARALALRPALVVADEPTSSLDVSVQADILLLLRTLQAEHGFGVVFISHDLAVVEQIADTVAVLQHGALVEHGPVGAVLGAPQQPYTRRLVAATPVLDPRVQRERLRAMTRRP